MEEIVGNTLGNASSVTELDTELVGNDVGTKGIV